RYVKSPRDPFTSLGAEFPYLALDMADMRFVHLLEAKGLNHFHQAKETGAQRDGKVLDLRIHGGTEGFDRPSHICYIAYLLLTINTGVTFRTIPEIQCPDAWYGTSDSLCFMRRN